MIIPSTIAPNTSAKSNTSVAGKKCCSPWKKKLMAGFTLVEMLVTVTVIGVISAVSVPAFNGIGSSTSLTSGARDVSSILSVARSEAIARNTVIRFAVAKDWYNNSESNFRKYSLWEWNKETEEYAQLTAWSELPNGVVLEPYLPEYVKSASYVQDDATSVRGDYVLEDSYDVKAQFATPDEEVYMNFIEFLPNGSVRIPNGSSRNAIFVLTGGYTDNNGEVIRQQADVKNWAQVNVDSLTGRVRLYRP